MVYIQHNGESIQHTDVDKWWPGRLALYNIFYCQPPSLSLVPSLSSSYVRIMQNALWIGEFNIQGNRSPRSPTSTWESRSYFVIADNLLQNHKLGKIVNVFSLFKNKNNSVEVASRQIVTSLTSLWKRTVMAVSINST